MWPRSSTPSTYERRPRRERNPAPPLPRCIPAIRMFCDAHPQPPVRARSKGNSAQVFEPRHAYTFKIAIQRTCQSFSRLVDRQWSPLKGARNRAQHEGQVRHGTPHASRSADRHPCQRRFGGLARVRAMAGIPQYCRTPPDSVRTCRYRSHRQPAPFRKPAPPRLLPRILRRSSSNRKDCASRRKLC